MSIARLVQIAGQEQEHLTKHKAVITSDHAYIHDGLGYVLSGITGSVASEGTYKISFQTPSEASGKFIHWRPAHIAGSATGITFELFKGSSSISGGSSALSSIVNLNQNVVNPSKMQAFDIGRTVTDGDRLQILFGGSAGTGSTSSGGGIGGNEERLLEPDTVYTGTFTNRSGLTATLIIYEFFWYEEEG